MIKYLRRFIYVVLGITLTVSCRKKAWDEFYGRPKDLAQPIVQVLESEGHFDYLLQLIEKAGYEKSLNGAGYWTFFAPNDDAFSSFFKANNLSGVDGIDSIKARSIIQYLLVYNAFKEDRIDDYQSTKDDAGWLVDEAFRRRTAFYNQFYEDVNASGKEIVAIANNRNSKGGLDGNYVSADHNNKYITYFTDVYFNKHNLSAGDYNYFYPNSQFSGFNVGQADVVRKDIDAENGVIHEIDRVLTPEPSIDEYLKEKLEYKSFWNILNRLNINRTVSFIYSQEASHRYEILNGKSDSVFVKVYSSLLPFAPNNENFLKEEDNDGQQDCWTLFAPDNQATNSYVDTVLLKYYKSFDEMPVEIIMDFLSAQMFPTAVWPSKFDVTHNLFGETPQMDPYTNVSDRELLSNGFFYGSNKVVAPGKFSSVYGEAYLNPSFRMMTRLFDVTGLNLLISNTTVPVDIFLIPDAVFKEVGYVYNESKEQFEFHDPNTGSSTTNSVLDDLTRIVQTCIFFEPFRSLSHEFEGQGVVRAGDEGTEGEYMKYDNGSIVTAGLKDNGEVAHVTKTLSSANGHVYYLDKLPLFSKNDVGFYIKELGEDPGSEFNYFWQYLQNSLIFNKDNNSIIGINGFTTVFVPDNDAVLKAVNDGVLPGSDGVPNFSPSDVGQQDEVRKFIQYHILDGHTVIPNGRFEGSYDTFLKNAIGDPEAVIIGGGDGEMTITDNQKRNARVIVSESDHLANRSMIHLIDNYLAY